MRREADEVFSVELLPGSAEVDFPAFTAGAHVDLHLPNGLLRSYSLCNSQSDSQRYVIGVLNDRASRGGSRFVHEQLRVGSTIEISRPRNNFQLYEKAGHSVLVAGGIGITPIYSMLQRLHALRRPTTLFYCGRAPSASAFHNEIMDLVDSNINVHWHFDNMEGTPPDLQRLLAGHGRDDHYYCCGPTPMLDAFDAACETLGFPYRHVERFSAALTSTSFQGFAYTVELRRSARTIAVPAGKSLLDTLLEAGVEPDYGCKEGVCGACECRVLGGVVDHRDELLSTAQKAANKTMLICVSGCKSEKLVLDL